MPATEPAPAASHAGNANPLWGKQTQLAIAHFAIGGDTVPEPLLRALIELKGAAAVVNARLGRLDEAVAAAVRAACDELLAGPLPAQFPLSPWQSGSMTQSHMNVNEVLATMASRRCGRPVHPNDEVNLGQSSNDMVPSAMHLAALGTVTHTLLPALHGALATLDEQERRHAGILKLGRTHLQDAVPMPFAAEIGGWAAAVRQATAGIAACAPTLAELAVGGTAVGTGLNTHPDFAAAVCAELSARTGLALRPAGNRYAALAGHEPLVALHGALKVLAVALMRVANDIRLLASGPRGGLAELRLPENEPGSSIMPGKVNPTQCKSMMIMYAQMFDNNVAVTTGAAAGHLQLNTCKPLIAMNVLRSVRLLADGVRSFDEHALTGMAADATRMDELLRGSLMLVTALTPHIGYDRAARIALAAHHERRTLREAALADGIAAADFDRWADPAAMVPAQPA